MESCSIELTTIAILPCRPRYLTAGSQKIFEGRKFLRTPKVRFKFQIITVIKSIHRVYQLFQEKIHLLYLYLYLSLVVVSGKIKFRWREYCAANNFIGTH